MEASGGGAPFSWSASNLPAGMSLSTAGVLSGTPLTAGTSSVAVLVSDSAGHAANVSLSLVIQSSGGGGGGSPSITTTTLPYAVVGASFSQFLAASGGAPPYAWSIAGLPGMNYNGYGSLAPIDMTNAMLSVQAV